MGFMPDNTNPEELLKNEILITNEVRTLAYWSKERGALLFGLSDKPDEASVPNLEMEKAGYKSIHQTPTHVVGEV